MGVTDLFQFILCINAVADCENTEDFDLNFQCKPSLQWSEPRLTKARPILSC